MLTIRKEQMQAFEFASFERDVKWLSGHILSLAQDTADVLSERTRDDVARHVIETGQRYEITGKRDLAMLLEIMISTFGHEFHVDPLNPHFGRVLARRDGLFFHPTIRVEKCYEHYRCYCDKLFSTPTHLRRVLIYIEKTPFDPTDVQQSPAPADQLIAFIAQNFQEKFDTHSIFEIEKQITATMRSLADYGIPASRLCSKLSVYSFLFGFNWFIDPAFPEIKAIFDQFMHGRSELSVAPLNEAMTVIWRRLMQVRQALGG